MQHARSHRWPTFSRLRRFYLIMGLHPSRLILGNGPLDPAMIGLRRDGPAIDGTEKSRPDANLPWLPEDSSKPPAIVHVSPLRMGKTVSPGRAMTLEYLRPTCAVPIDPKDAVTTTLPRQVDAIAGIGANVRWSRPRALPTRVADHRRGPIRSRQAGPQLS